MAALVAVYALPGALLSRWLLPRAGALERCVTSLALGIATVSPTLFAVVLARSAPITLGWLFGISVVWAGIGLALARWWPTEPREPVFDSASSRLLVGVGAVVATWFVGGTTMHAVDATDVWWHCPHMSSLYLLEDGTGPGITSWDPAWDTLVTHRIHHDGAPAFGLGPVLRIQRAGNMAFLAAPVAFMSLGGVAAALWLFDFLIFGFAALLAGRYLRSAPLLVVVCTLFVLGTRALAGYHLNENALALVLSMAALHFALKEPGLPLALAAGVLFAHLLGVRPITVLMLPAFLFLVRRPPAACVAAAVALVVFGLPWAVGHALAFGDPFGHPAMAFATHSVMLFAGTPLEVSLSFYPLNPPFGDTLTTGPQHPFPALLRFPLEALQSYSAPILALAIAGLVALRRERALVSSLLLWALPVPLILSFIVQLDYQKLSFLLIASAPLPLLVGAGLTRLDLSTAGRGGLAAVVAALLVVAPAAVRDLEFPVHPGVHAAYLGGTHDMLSPEEQRARLTAPAFLPFVPKYMDLLVARESMAVELIRTSARAGRSAAPADPIDGPVTLWAPRERTIDHEVTIRLKPTPTLPPSYRVAGGLTGSSRSGGGTLYSLRLEPAYEAATVRIRRVGGQTTTAVAPVGEPTGRMGYLTFLVVDRASERIVAPIVSIAGAEATPRVVSVLSLPELDDVPDRTVRWSAEPRIVANHPLGLGWEDTGALAFFDDDPPPVRLHSEVLCEDRKTRLVRACADENCPQLLLTRDGRLRAVRRLGGGDRVIAVDDRYPALSRPTECESALLRLTEDARGPRMRR